MSFWLASRAMDRAVLPSCREQEQVGFSRICHRRIRFIQKKEKEETGRGKGKI